MQYFPLGFVFNLKNFKGIRILMGHLITTLIKTKTFVYKKDCWSSQLIIPYHWRNIILFCCFHWSWDWLHPLRFFVVLFFNYSGWGPGLVMSRPLLSKHRYMSLTWFGSWSKLGNGGFLRCPNRTFSKTLSDWKYTWTSSS